MTSTYDLNPLPRQEIGFNTNTTLQNILEYVGKKASVEKFILFDIIDGQVLRSKYQWPHDLNCVCFTMLKELQNHHTNKFIRLTNEVAYSDEKQEHSWLMMPIRQKSNTTSNLLGFLSFGSSAPTVEWTTKQINLLELARDLIETTTYYSAIFINLDQQIANMSIEEINDRLSKEQSQMIEKIVVLFENIRRHSKINDLWRSIGIDTFKSKLARFILGNQPILMVLPAFPFKNRNQIENVIGSLPDMGEVLALDNLNTFASKVSKIYDQGCNILIVSDGRVFNDIYPVSDTIVSNYTNHIHSLGQHHLQFIGLDELFSSIADNNDKREAILQLYDHDKDSVDRKLNEDAHFHGVYVSFKRFLRKDIGESRSLTAAKAKLMMMRNESYSELIRILFPHHIRLSIHDHNCLEKIGIHLVGDSVITPWHGVPVKLRNGTWTIMRKRQALEMGCVLEDLITSASHSSTSLNEEFQSLDLDRNKEFCSLPFYREI